MFIFLLVSLIESSIEVSLATFHEVLKLIANFFLVFGTHGEFGVNLFLCVLDFGFFLVVELSDSFYLKLFMLGLDLSNTLFLLCVVRVL